MCLWLYSRHAQTFNLSACADWSENSSMNNLQILLVAEQTLCVAYAYILYMKLQVTYSWFGTNKRIGLLIECGKLIVFFSIFKQCIFSFWSIYAYNREIYSLTHCSIGKFGSYTSNNVYINSDPFIHVNGENDSLTHCSIGEFGAYTVFF